jgi:hypothetical protein
MPTVISFDRRLACAIERAATGSAGFERRSATAAFWQ